jgi:hypothetical protein
LTWVCGYAAFMTAICWVKRSVSTHTIRAAAEDRRLKRIRSVKLPVSITVRVNSEIKDWSRRNVRLEKI